MLLIQLMIWRRTVAVNSETANAVDKTERVLQMNNGLYKMSSLKTKAKPSGRKDWWPCVLLPNTLNLCPTGRSGISLIC